MLRIKVKDGNIEKALKQYKSKVIKTRQLKSIRNNRYYDKPTSENRLKMQKAIRIKDWNINNKKA